MTFSRLALLLAAVSLVAVRVHADNGNDSDSDSEQNKKPPTEIPDFSHLDEYIYVPHSNLNYGYRFSNGPRLTFSGHANITPDMANNALSAVSGQGTEGVTDHSSPNILRVYHDGTVGTDDRSTQIDLGNGQVANQPVNSADGKTDRWGYDSTSQVTSEDFIQFHQYSDTTNGSPSYSQNSRGNVGLEAYVAYDWKHLSKKVDLKLFVGVSLNDLAASTMSTVSSTLTTQTDTYSLFGATPAAPGGPGASGSTSVLISAAPVIPTQITQNTSDTTDLTQHFKLHGAYLTVRFGPEMDFNFSDHLKLSLSVGPTLIYAGSTLDTDAVLIPPTGFQIVDQIDSTTNRLLYGGYADLTLNYLVTDRTGFYLGGFDQMSTGYTQGASSIGGVFTTKVDFNNEHGLRSGLSYKF